MITTSEQRSDPNADLKHFTGTPGLHPKPYEMLYLRKAGQQMLLLLFDRGNRQEHTLVENQTAVKLVVVCTTCTTTFRGGNSQISYHKEGRISNQTRSKVTNTVGNSTLSMKDRHKYSYISSSWATSFKC